jgi:hypothetical protein
MVAMLWRKRGLHLGRLVALVALWACVGCSHPVARQIEGRWFGETVENFDPDDIPVATGWARGTSFEFSGGRVTISIPAEEPRSGRFEVVSAHDRDVVIDILGDGVAGGPMAMTLLKEDVIRWHLDDLRSVLLRRE